MEFLNLNLSFKKRSKYLESILELVDDGPHGAEVSVGSIDLGDGLEGSLRPQMILERSHDVAAAGGHRLVLRFGLGFRGQRGHGQAEAGRSAVGGAGLATVTIQEKY